MPFNEMLNYSFIFMRHLSTFGPYFSKVRMLMKAELKMIQGHRSKSSEVNEAVQRLE